MIRRSNRMISSVGFVNGVGRQRVASELWEKHTNVVSRRGGRKRTVNKGACAATGVRSRIAGALCRSLARACGVCSRDTQGYGLALGYILSPADLAGLAARHGATIKTFLTRVSTPSLDQL